MSLLIYDYLSHIQNIVEVFQGVVSVILLPYVQRFLNKILATSPVSEKIHAPPLCVFVCAYVSMI